MINFYADALLCGLVTVAELIIAIFSLALVQLLTYQFFGINLYQKISKKLNRLDKYLNEIF